MAGEETPQGQGESPLSVATDSDPFAERPEIYVGGAFAGGLLVALLLRGLSNR